MNPTLRRILLYACLVAALMGYAFVQGREAQANDEAVSYGQAVLGGHPGFARRMASDSLVVARLRRLGATKADSERFWKQVAQTALADTLDTTGAPQTPNFPAATVALGKVLTFCDAARAASDSAVTILSSSLAACRSRGDSLEGALRGLLRTRTCRILFFPCLSRTEVFFLGAIGGFALSRTLH